MDTIVRWKPIICEETISESFFDSELINWHLKFGSEPKATADFILAMFNQKIGLINKKNLEFKVRYVLLTKTYWQLIIFLQSVERDTANIRTMINRLDLEKIELEDKESEFESGVQISSENCCSNCDKHDGLTVTIQDAIKLDVLPFMSCTRKSGCTCCYTSVFLRDSQERLKRKPGR